MARALKDLVSVGPATVGDFHQLGIFSVEALVGQDPVVLKERLEALTGHRQDPCVEDVFRAAIHQAEDPDLPKEQCQWYYWSRVRKAGGLKG
jgi:hypothetical protein